MWYSQRKEESLLLKTSSYSSSDCLPNSFWIVRKAMHVSCSSVKIKCLLYIARSYTSLVSHSFIHYTTGTTRTAKEWWERTIYAPSVAVKLLPWEQCISASIPIRRTLMSGRRLMRKLLATSGLIRLRLDDLASV